MRKDYEILGIDENADEKAIKRAYFSLVRTYSPEKDPERFQEIRAAYERLTEAKDQPENTIELEFPEDDKFAVRMFDQIQQLLEEEDYGLALQTAEEGLKYYPDMECFLYMYGRCSILNGNAGKAVKTYQKLVKRFPDKVYYKCELAKAYYQRGYVRKAQDMFQKAYQEGMRQTDFLLEYSWCSYRRKEYAQALEALSSLIDSIPPEKTMDKLPELMEAYAEVFMITCLTGFEPDRFADGLSELLERAGDRILDYEDMLIQVYLAAGTASLRLQDNPKLKALIEQMGMRMSDVVQEMMPPEMREGYSVLEDERFGETMKLTVKAFMFLDDEFLLSDLAGEIDDPDEYEEFMQLDAFLCQLEEWPNQKKELELLRREYPNVYECGEDVWDLLKRSTGQKSAMISAALVDYVRLERKYQCGRYYELYPNRRQAPVQVQWDRLESGTYVRQEKKIGRNSPCPCGSGKKYKNCCGRGK